MAKRGRKKKPGARYNCGKRHPSALRDEVTRTAIDGRMRTLGVSREVAALADIGSPLGRLLHWNFVTQNQADAGYDFAVTLRNYLATAQLQRPGQGKAGFIPAQRASGESPAPVRGEAKARAYMEALAEIDRSDPYSSPTATSVVWDICINEADRMREADIGALRVGLNAIYRIMYGRKAA